MTKTDVVSISDIHIGNNTDACWYRNSFHDGYLKRILEYVVSNADDLKEFIILGDLFDFWTYAPDVKPPTVADIITANSGTTADPGIFGLGNIFDTAVTAMEGRVSYVVGNHDITLTQADLDLIPLSGGYKITKKPDEYTVGNCLFTHGHLFTIFNAPPIPYTGITTPTVPLGHFVTRMIAYYVENQVPLVPAYKMTGFGAPAERQMLNMSTFAPVFTFLKSMFGTHAFGPDSVSKFIDLWVQVTGFPASDSFKMAGTAPDVTIPEIKTTYANLFTQWIALHNKEYVRKSMVTDGTARSMSWFTQQASLKTDVDLCVTGHTHWPTNGVKALVNDVNCGFECFAEPDKATSKYTFARIKNVDTTPVPEIYAIKAGPKNIGFSCQPAANIPKGEIIFNPLSLPVSPKDYSVFVRVINNSTNTLTPSSPTATHGKWVVAPPTIDANSTLGFWIQDSLGVHGADGSVKYSYGTEDFTLHFDCPTGVFNNKASVTGSAKSNVSLKARTGDGAWSSTVPTSDHPLSVIFTVS